MVSSAYKRWTCFRGQYFVGRLQRVCVSERLVYISVTCNLRGCMHLSGSDHASPVQRRSLYKSVGIRFTDPKDPVAHDDPPKVT